MDAHSQQGAPHEHSRSKEKDKPALGELQPYSDPYLILDIPRAATSEQIKDAYFGQVRAHPPEREPDAFKQIRAAYDRLRTPERRVETDMLLLQEVDLATELTAPAFDLDVHREDLLSMARAFSDLERTDFREHFRKV